MSLSDLIKLQFSKNNQGDYQCPITFKTFNDHTHIVAIKNTGNVFSFDAVQELNMKSKFWKDLLTDEPFTRKDIITLQDPHNMGSKDMTRFDFVKKGLDGVDKSAQELELESDPAANINNTGSISRILGEMAKADKPAPVQVPNSLAPTSSSTTSNTVQAKKPIKQNVAHFSNGLQAYSLTSMAFTPSTKGT